MQQQTLYETQGIQLVVNDHGNAMLFHRGPLPYDFIWAQYDQQEKIMQLITDDGIIQELGMTIHDPFHDSLMMARELYLIEVDENKNYINPRLIKFTALVH